MSTSTRQDATNRVDAHRSVESATVTGAGDRAPAPRAPVATEPADGAPAPAQPRTTLRRLAVHLAAAVAVGAVVAATAWAIDAARGAGEPALGPGVVRIDVGIHHSRFDIGRLRVVEGTILELVVHNGDPIDHELVIGDASVHRRHAAGTERRHPPVPGEVSIAPGDTAMTFYELTEPGTVTYACHLPGHVAYGMIGEIEVLPRS
jgi:uncharacterized cupredoxin-like copper-binding protein